MLLALHARRSADSVARWAQAHAATDSAPGLAVVLTGTDLYRDIATDTAAQASLHLAQRLVVLQECGPDALPQPLRHKARVVFQSTALQTPLLKPAAPLQVLMVGHLREEKSPQTLWEAARLLPPDAGICIDHIGAALAPEWAALAQACMRDCPHYCWLGGVPHADTLQAMAQAHLLVHTSRMEGGAHVLLEAVCSGTPVLASRIPGNVGMLGADYAGYFTPGDAQALAAMLQRCRAPQRHHDGLYARLQQQCAARAPLFSPAAEQAAVRALVDELLHAPMDRGCNLSTH